MIKRGSLVLFLLVVSIFSVNAAVLDINTLPDHDIWITAKHPVSQESVMSPMKFSSNENGSLILTYEIYESFTLFITVKDEGNLVTYMRGEEVYDRDDYISLDLFPEGYVAPVRESVVQLESNNTDNESALNETNATNATENISVNQSQNETYKISGFSFPQISIDPNYIYYIAAAVILIFLIIILSRRKSISKKIKSIDKRIKNEENKIEELRAKKKKLLEKAKEEMIKREEALIKFRGGSVPEKKEEKSMIQKLKESMTKDKK